MRICYTAMTTASVWLTHDILLRSVSLERADLIVLLTATSFLDSGCLRILDSVFRDGFHGSSWPVVLAPNRLGVDAVGHCSGATV